jgi:hypothetical protein
MANEITLEPRLVGKITGQFFVPSYQRGYRWGVEEVTRLLDDVYSISTSTDNKNYCLQPIVVRRLSDGSFELIDGQQRLTTIYLIYKYMHKAGGRLIPEAKFKLSYETRPESANYLDNLDEGLKDNNIDFWHINQAYETIRAWFEKQEGVSAYLEISTYFEKNVRVIWYEVGPEEDSISLFTRLNIGKIPLTSAELVKAMFLSEDNYKKDFLQLNAPKKDALSQEDIDELVRRRQEEIAFQWDSIEQELHNKSLWFFLTNSNIDEYQTRIDLVLDLISKKPANSRETYFTFFAIEAFQQNEPLEDVWKRIRRSFLTLKDWHDNHELYHKIGYLIASGAEPLSKLFLEAQNRKKDEFAAYLDTRIKASVFSTQNYATLTFEKSTDKSKISRLLLLFNVESVRKNGEQTQWFPFDKYKDSTKGTVRWSLEHIHAQVSKSMTQENNKEWLKLHAQSIRDLAEGSSEKESRLALANEMEELAARPRLEGTDFDAILTRAYDVLNADNGVEYIHTISNLALLNTSTNAALNNSAFDVKRNDIIKMDMQGKFIPFCTKMAFLKYYTESGKNQLHFWGYEDRIAYVGRMNEVLRNYLPAPITLESRD